MTRWSVPIGSGYSGPTVADGRVYVTDRIVDPEQIERGSCFAWETGKEIWRTSRDEISSWGTPNFYNKGNYRQIVVNGWKHMGAYDFDTGKGTRDTCEYCSSCEMRVHGFDLCAVYIVIYIVLNHLTK